MLGFARHAKFREAAALPLDYHLQLDKAMYEGRLRRVGMFISPPMLCVATILKRFLENSDFKA